MKVLTGCTGSPRRLADVLAACRRAVRLIALTAAAGAGREMFAAPAPLPRPGRPSTICVALFQEGGADTGLGVDLTRAIIREVQVRTPFRVVGEGPADSDLGGKVVCEVQAARTVCVRVELAWKDGRGTTLFPRRGKTALLQAVAGYRPELGESRATAIQAAVERLAAQVAASLER